MSKFCSQCGSMMEDAQMFCGVCGAAAQAPQNPAPQQAPQYGAAPQYSAPQQAPQYGAAPQYSAPQQAPQYGAAPQYSAPQQAPQYGAAPQYSAPQQAPQYGAAPQYSAPQQAPQYGAAPQYGVSQQKPATPGAFSSFFANMDWMGMLTGKAPIFQNCLAALAVQFISFILFFLPMVKASVFGFSESTGLFSGFSGTAGILLPVIAILALLGGITFLVLPLFMKKEIRILNVLVFAGCQVLYFLLTVVGAIVLVAQVNKYVSGGITVGFILFVLFTLAAIFVSGRILFFNKDEAMAIFKKQPAGNVAANNVPGAYPAGDFQNNVQPAPAQENNFPGNPPMN